MSPAPGAIVVAGPTASGKTALALALARAFGAEIISCDSRQIYKRLAAGTDKPEGLWRTAPHGGESYFVENIPYHLVDFLDPREEFSAADYVRVARPIVDGIAAAGRGVVMAGGTGLYIKAFWEGLDPMPPRDPAVRASLEEAARVKGRAALHARLAQADPVAAAGIPPNNLQRVVRALEVLELTGKPISSFWTKTKAAPRNAQAPLTVGLRWPKELLRERIQKRCARVFPLMIEEVRTLLADGYSADAPGLKSLGYPQALGCLAGDLPRSEALSLYQTAVLQYAKRQRTWFERQDVRWIDIARPADADPEICARSILEWKK